MVVGWHTLLSISRYVMRQLELTLLFNKEERSVLLSRELDSRSSQILPDRQPSGGRR